MKIGNITGQKQGFRLPTLPRLPQKIALKDWAFFFSAV
jgi:hypothetical protein